MAAGMIYENPAHHLGRHRDELNAVLPAGPLVDQTQVGFVDEGRGLQGVTGPLAAQVRGGAAAQFRVQEDHQAIPCRRITRPPSMKECRGVNRRRRPIHAKIVAVVPPKVNA
jgi:hypothetical protein